MSVSVQQSTLTITANGVTQTVQVGIPGPQGPAGSAPSNVILSTGGTMTGDLELPAGNPATSNSAVPKNYVDGEVFTELTRAEAAEALIVSEMVPGINVKSSVYGAAGNGITDDTTAIQNAMAAAGPSGATLFFPPGNYIISSPLLWQPSPGGETNQAFNAPSIKGAGPGATSPRFANGAQGSTQLTASGTFPTGQFLIDYIGDTGANNCIAGYELSGFSVQCNSRAAGMRNCNAHTSVHRFITINKPATPSPTNNIGSPTGGFSAVASPTTNAYNNHYDTIIVFGAGQDGIDFGEGTGSSIFGRNCTALNCGRYGMVAFDGATLVSCYTQANATADFEVWGATLIGCNNQAYFGGGKANALLMVGNSNRRANIIGGQYAGNSNAGTTGENAALVNFGSGGQGFEVMFSGVNFVSGSHTAYWFYIPGTATTGNVSFQSCTFQTSGGAITTANYNIVAALSSTFQVSVKNSPGLNPFGVQTVAVPSSGTPTTALPFNTTFYVTAGASGATTVAISGGPTITIPPFACVPVRVPAGQTLTATYTSAPTWVVEGE